MGTLWRSLEDRRICLQVILSSEKDWIAFAHWLSECSRLKIVFLELIFPEDLKVLNPMEFEQFCKWIESNSHIEAIIANDISIDDSQYLTLIQLIAQNPRF